MIGFDYTVGQFLYQFYTRNGYIVRCHISKPFDTVTELKESLKDVTPEQLGVNKVTIYRYGMYGAEYIADYELPTETANK